jgi:multidrug efflux system membrane fusion protein
MNTSRRTSILMAIGVAIAVALWMLSGIGGNSSDTDDLAQDAGSEGPMRVRVAQVRASDVTREITLSARTEPNRVVQLKAETDGAVVELGIDRGTDVWAGNSLVKLDIRDRNARLREAESLIVQRELELQGRQNLKNQQYASDVEIAEAQARLDSARSARERIQLEIRNTDLVAPFEGIIQERWVEIGDYVRAGDPVVELVDIDPLIIAGEVNGKDVTELAIGSMGYATLVDGTELAGTIRYVAPVADENTRTFRVELAVPNPGLVRAGLTAELKLSGSRISAHDLSSALLTLSDEGAVGVKVVNDNNRVEFYSIEIVGASNDGILVTGLPDAARVITVGQGFVTEGQQVEPVAFSALEEEASYERAN